MEELASTATIFSLLDTVWKEGMNEDITNTVILAFKVRDIRGPHGERSIFYAMLSYIFSRCPDMMECILALVPEYGTWADIFRIASRYPEMKAAVFKLAKAQLLEDEAAVARGDHQRISLLAKWAPREGKALGHLAREFAVYTAPVTTHKHHSQRMAAYRKRLSALNRLLGTVEILECAGRWDEIEPSSVPLRARKTKKSAYLNEKVGKTVLRHPDDMARMVCRRNFIQFLQEKAQPLLQTPQEPQEVRYDPVRKSLKEWFEGGWRGVV